MHPHLNRRQLLAASTLALAAPALWAATEPRRDARLPAVEVWKDPSCGCCQDWIEHLRAEGFAVTLHVR